MRRQKAYFQLCGFVAFLTAGLIFYSQTYAFAWDEGFHLLAAQLISKGERPYLDFLFPQTPLNAYWNAALMHVFGWGWRAVHVFATLFTGGAILLAADFIFVHFPVPHWRLACASAAALFIATNAELVDFATVGQANGLCLLLIVTAFRLSPMAASRKLPSFAAATGLLAGAAAASSLLTAAVAPVLFIWILLHNRAGSGWLKGLLFACAASAPFGPVLWLFVRGPHQVLFNVVQYQALFRRVNWGNATEHDVDILTLWITSAPVFLLGVLGLAGWTFVRKSPDLDSCRRGGFLLCGWISLGMGLELVAAHPTFERYFILIVPFVAILSAAEFYSVASRLFNSERPMWPVVALGVFLIAALGKTLSQDTGTYSWTSMQRVADKVAEVTPGNATLWADEPVYFLLHRTPPSGMEFGYAHKLELPPEEAARLHILSGSELKRRLNAGVFDTVELCEDDDMIQSLNLPKLFAQKEVVGECTVFWEKVRATQ